MSIPPPQKRGGGTGRRMMVSKWLPIGPEAMQCRSEELYRLPLTSFRGARLSSVGPCKTQWTSKSVC
jgi:hypothetical protein